MPWDAGRSLGGNATISETDTSRTSTASTRRSAIRRRRKFRLLCRTKKLDGGTTESHENPAGSVFIFNIAVVQLTMADELELMAVHIIWEMVVISVSCKEFLKIDGECRQDTHKTHLCSAHRTHNALGLAQVQDEARFACIFVPQISLVIWCVTCLIHGCSLTRLPPWALLLLYLPVLPHNENTH